MAATEFSRRSFDAGADAAYADAADGDADAAAELILAEPGLGGTAAALLDGVLAGADDGLVEGALCAADVGGDDLAATASGAWGGEGVGGDVFDEGGLCGAPQFSEMPAHEAASAEYGAGGLGLGSMAADADAGQLVSGVSAAVADDAAPQLDAAMQLDLVKTAVGPMFSFYAAMRSRGAGYYDETVALLLATGGDMASLVRALQVYFADRQKRGVQAAGYAYGVMEHLLSSVAQLDSGDVPRLENAEALRVQATGLLLSLAVLVVEFLGARGLVARAEPLRTQGRLELDLLEYMQTMSAPLDDGGDGVFRVLRTFTQNRRVAMREFVWGGE